MLLQRAGHDLGDGPRDAQWLQRMVDALCDLSSRDALTGLANRRQFDMALERECDRVARSGEPALVLLLDIDHFKRVNDTYGHMQGDVVLQKVAIHIQKELRSYDIAARYGGEEFVAVLPDTSLKEAFNVAERIRLSVKGMRFAGSLSNEFVTVSLGIALFPSPCFDDIDGLLRSADEALYQAKEQGRNRVVISDPAVRLKG